MAAVGGPGPRGADARCSPRGPRRRARARLPRAQRAAARRRSSSARAWTTCCSRAQGARAGGSASSRRSGASTVELAFAAAAARPTSSTSSSAATRPSGTSRRPIRSLLALERLGASPEEAAYVGDSPFDMQAAQAGGHVRGRRHLGPHPRPRRARATPTWSSTPRRSCLPSSKSSARARRRAARAAQPLALRVPRARRAVGRRRRVRPRTTTSSSSSSGAPRARHARLADPARRRAAVRPLPEGAPPRRRWARSRR